MSRDYKKEYAEYHSRPEQKKNRAKRNKAHRNSNCGPGQEVDHKVPLSKGGSNSPSNWRVVSKETNRKKGTKKMSSFDRLRLAIVEKTAAPDGVERLPSGAIKYRDETFPGYNKPKAAPKGSKHKKRVLAKKGDKVKVVNFGARGYKHNYSAKAKKSYLARSAGIKGKDDKFSANYWSRRELWPKNQKADGSSKKRSKTSSYGKLLGYGAATLGGAAATGALTGSLGDRGALAGAKNTVSTMVGDAVTGGGLGATIGAIGLTLASRGKLKPANLMTNAALGAVAGGATGAYVGAGIGNLRSHGQNIWGSANMQKTSSASEFDAAAYYANLSPEQRQTMQDAVNASLLGVTKEMNTEMEPLNKELQELYAPYQDRIKSITDKYNPRLQKALIAGYRKGGASDEYLNYLKNQQADFTYMGKIASADDNFNTSAVEAFMDSVRK